MKDLEVFVDELKALGVTDEVILKALIVTATKKASSIDDLLERSFKMLQSKQQTNLWSSSGFPAHTEYIRTTL